MTSDTLRTWAIWLYGTGISSLLVGGILGALGVWDGVTGLTTIGLILILNGCSYLGLGASSENVRTIVKKQDERIAALELRLAEKVSVASPPV